MTTVYVCPERDIECGRNPASWCATCPQRKKEGTPGLSKPEIRMIFLANGFTVKEGETDLKPYVYQAANALIDAALCFAKTGIPAANRDDEIRTRDELFEAYTTALQHIANGHPNAQQFAKVLLAIRDDPDLIK